MKLIQKSTVSGNSWEIYYKPRMAVTTWVSALVDKEPLENIGAGHPPSHTVLPDLEEELKKKKEFNKSSTVIFNYLGVHVLGYYLY